MGSGGAGRRQEEIAKRRERALRESPVVERVGGDVFFGDYRVAGSRSSSYLVQMALEPRRQPTCTCHDFATNGLNTCKHVEAVRMLLAQTPEAGEWADPVSLAQADLAALDVVAFDLETQRLFQEVGGRHNISRLGLAVGVLYALGTGSFGVYGEGEAEAMVDRLTEADLVVGFNVLNFDYPVLEPYGGRRLYRTPTLDMMLLVAEEVGFRVSLDALAQATLGQGKTADGLQAVQWYRDGRVDLVEEYCRQDVTVTAALFLHGREEGSLRFVRRDGTTHTVRAAWQVPAVAAG